MFTVSNFLVGDRVQLHPATNLWMQGDRYGEVVKIRRGKVTLKMDRSGRVIRAFPHDISEII